MPVCAVSVLGMVSASSGSTMATSRGDVEVGQRIFDALGVVGDDRESGNFRGRAGGRGDGQELGFLTQLGES